MHIFALANATAAFFKVEMIVSSLHCGRQHPLRSIGPVTRWSRLRLARRSRIKISVSKEKYRAKSQNLGKFESYFFFLFTWSRISSRLVAFRLETK